MRVLLSWLEELVPLNESLDHLTEKLSMAGFEVEEIIDRSSYCKGVVVGFIKDTAKHPNADKLTICSVDIGANQTLQIVCGASNVRSGIHVPVAPIGSFLPAANLQIKKGKLRGIESHGMICSLGELGVKTDSDGICVLDDDHSSLPELGQPIADLLDLNDVVIELAITANRPDGLSMVGIAREVSALFGTKTNLPLVNKRLKFKNLEASNFDRRALNVNSLYSLTVIEEVDTTISSDELIKARLKSSGINPINSVVDFTNYIMLEQGQPFHAFDVDKLKSITGKEVDESSFGIRAALEGEEFNALNGIKYELSVSSYVITCHDFPVALAGVIGGMESAVDERTKKIIIEAAIFNPSVIRCNTKQIGLRTESSSRFEKGIAFDNTLVALERLVELLATHNHGSLKSSYVCKNERSNYKAIPLRRNRVQKILGPLKGHDIQDHPAQTNQNVLIEDINFNLMEIPDNCIEESLLLLGCLLTNTDEGWLVQVPSMRKMDLTREIDLIEEVARIVGYDSFESFLPDPLKPGGLSSKQKAKRKLIESLCSSGLQEITTMSLVGYDENDSERIALSNPLLSETSHLRTNLWEEHLSICKKNFQIGKSGVWLFEIGNIYKRKDSTISEIPILSGIVSGVRRLERWKKIDTAGIDYFDARGILSRVLDGLNLQVIDKRLVDEQLFHPGRASELILEGRNIGRFGQIHPRITEEKNLPTYTYVFELLLDDILGAATRKNKINPIFRQYITTPTLERDISLLVDRTNSTEAISRDIKKSGKKLLEDVHLIDRFEDDVLYPEKVSLTFRLIFRGDNKTLNEEDIKDVYNNIINELERKHLAHIRS